MFRFFRRLLHRSAARVAAATVPAVAADATGQPWTLRRWEAAQTNRLNAAHWETAMGQSINADLTGSLETLRARCQFEAANNPMVAGVINTHAVDVVGRIGPTLQVHSDNEAYNDALEAAWKTWFHAPTTNPRITGPELLRLWVRGLWINGEFLAQQVTKRRDGQAVTLRLKTIHPRRLATPPAMAGAADVVLGVRVSQDGEPSAYYISNPKRFGAHALDLGNYEPIPADLVCHGFAIEEEDQVRGVPWLAPCLQAVADLRDYDDQVLDAARAAADQATLLFTTHPDAEYIPVNESTTVERRTISTLPPGWQMAQMTPQQPSTRYVEYREERHRDIGRPVSMPLMIVRQDSSDHNYSSARFDAQGYHRGIGCLQTWISEAHLTPLVDAVAVESRFDRRTPRRPDRVEYVWTWPAVPHVDPLKERAAERIGLENGTLTYTAAVAAHGDSVENVIATRQRDAQALADAGLPPVPVAATSQAPDPNAPDPPPSKGRTAPPAASRQAPECPSCGSVDTIDDHGGRLCTECGHTTGQPHGAPAHAT